MHANVRDAFFAPPTICIAKCYINSNSVYMQPYGSIPSADLLNITYAGGRCYI